MSNRPALLLIPLLLLLAAPAHAREGAPDIQQFKPVTDVQGFVLLHDATQLPQFRPGFSLTLNYAANPLEVNAPGFGRQFGITDGIFGVDITGAFGLFNWWEVGLHFPIAQIPIETDFIANVGGKKVAYGIGDIRLETRLQALDPAKYPIGLAGNLFLTIPSGNEKAGLGRGKPGGGVRVIVSQRWTRFHFAANVGWAFYPRATIANLTTGDELTYGVGVGVTPVIDHLDIRLELDGSFTPGPNERDEIERFGDPSHSPLELLASVEYRFDFGLAIRGGVGKGLTPGFGSPDIRVFVGASWAIFKPIDRDKDGLPDPDDSCKKEPEDVDGWEDSDGCPDPNNDGDAFADLDDQCPDEAEDEDGWEDGDGCPDPDNDGDGLEDGIDTCPEEPEDADLFQDTDGCPDIDNDGDGILDVDDACPMNAETVDGWADEDGCPDPDNDGDGIEDEVDLCPNEAEDRNMVRDDDGCPDDKIAVRTGDSIAILEQILFKTGSARIDKKSTPIVQTVATLMVENPDILQLRIEGHTDNKGKSSANQTLSQRRAEAVMRALVSLGVDSARLEAVGYGDARPVGSNRTEEGRAKNRRIEFRILAQETGAVEVKPEPATENPWGVPATPAPAPEPLAPPEITPVENPW
jgi:outer membrane protein OmpA-like peptidoglycan-associated protein